MEEQDHSLEHYEESRFSSLQQLYKTAGEEYDLEYFSYLRHVALPKKLLTQLAVEGDAPTALQLCKNSSCTLEHLDHLIERGERLLQLEILKRSLSFYSQDKKAQCPYIWRKLIKKGDRLIHYLIAAAAELSEYPELIALLREKKDKRIENILEQKYITPKQNKQS